MIIYMSFEGQSLSFLFIQLEKYAEVFFFCGGGSKPIDDSPKGCRDENVTVLNQYRIWIYRISTTESFNTAMFLYILK